jgi:exosortase A-associated hydrolase 2
MNKSRRMVSLAARALAERGCEVLLVDLQGCGDSSGDFVDASWSGWQSDLRHAARWLRQSSPGPLVLWGHRCGCLLAGQVGPGLGVDVGYLFWQPVTAGRQQLQQFLRLRLAAELGTGAKVSVDELRQQLAADGQVFVAGYDLGASLARGLEAATLTPPGAPTRLAWLEVSSREDPALLPNSQAALAQWQAAGHRVHSRVVRGTAFWQTQEIEDAPELVGATVQAMDGLLAGA